MPEVPGWQRIAGRRADLAAAFRRRRPASASPAIAIAPGREVDLAIAVFARQSEGRELVGFGQGAVAPDGDWAWTADAAAPPDGRAERIASHGLVREVVSFYRVGDDADRERDGGEAGDDEDAPARRAAARGRGARLGARRRPTGVSAAPGDRRFPRRARARSTGSPTAPPGCD